MKNYKFTLLLSSINLISLSVTHAHEYESSRADSHAPISVMSDHIHQSGEWMFSVRHMRMEMAGLRSGQSSQTSQDIFGEGYTVAPTQMRMDMSMLGAMFAPSDRYTLMAMIPYLDLSMDHEIFPMAAPLISLNEGSQTFTTQSGGWGDLKLAAMLPFHKSSGKKAHFGFGFSFPTGSIAETDLIPVPGGRLPSQLPAPMQLGSGTLDALPSITFVSQRASWSYGAQASGAFRLNTNHHGYRRGNAAQATAWVARKVSNRLSLSVRLAYQYSGSMGGTQSDLSFNPPFAPSRRTVTTAFSDNYGGTRIDAAIGVNYYFSDGVASGNRIAIEFSSPLFEDLNGFQLKTKRTTTVGWQYSW